MSHSGHEYAWEKGFSIDFALTSGLSQTGQSTRRYLSNMKGMFVSQESYDAVIRQGDPMIYQFYELGCPAHPGDIAFGTSITYPGKIGDEYYFTKGHFHTVLETAEVYYCLSGTGIILIENPEGDSQALPVSPGQAAYIPKRYAHRSINVGNEPLVTFFAFRGDAGHNYGAIEKKGFRQIVVERDGKPVVLANPKWRRNHDSITAAC